MRVSFPSLPQHSFGLKATGGFARKQASAYKQPLSFSGASKNKLLAFLTALGLAIIPTVGCNRPASEGMGENKSVQVSELPSQATYLGTPSQVLQLIGQKAITHSFLFEGERPKYLFLGANGQKYIFEKPQDSGVAEQIEAALVAQTIQTQWVQPQAAMSIDTLWQAFLASPNEYLAAGLLLVGGGICLLAFVLNVRGNGSIAPYIVKDREGFEELLGIEEEVSEAKRFADAVKLARVEKKVGEVKRVLFISGEHKTGKTHMVEAIAQESQVPMATIDVLDMISNRPHNVSRLSKLFKTLAKLVGQEYEEERTDFKTLFSAAAKVAKQKGACILHVKNLYADEIMAKKQAGEDSLIDDFEGVLDELEHFPGVFVVVTSSINPKNIQIDDLPFALATNQVEMPSTAVFEVRKAIIRSFIEKKLGMGKEDISDENIEFLTHHTLGFKNSDIDDAFQYLLKVKKDDYKFSDIVAALDAVWYGPPKSCSPHETELGIVSCLGQALMAKACQKQILTVDFISRQRAFGYVKIVAPKNGLEEFETFAEKLKQIMLLVAGAAAECAYAGPENVTDYSKEDWKQALTIAESLTMPPFNISLTPHKLVDQAYRRATEILIPLLKNQQSEDVLRLHHQQGTTPEKIETLLHGFNCAREGSIQDAVNTFLISIVSERLAT